MERDLIKFNKNISKVSKEICVYNDDKGNSFLMPVGKLTCACEYQELDVSAYKQALFEGIIEKDIEYTKAKVTKQISKYQETKKEQDKYTIIDKEVEVYQVWIVKNGLGLAKPFNNKKEALNLTETLNIKYLKMAEQI